MKEFIQQKFWVHTRGIEMLLPPSFPHAENKSERLRQITNDGTLRRRYPDPDEGRDFMDEIDFDRRNKLLGMAQEANHKIIEEWKGINPDKNIAVILFGSVAKGLVKNPIIKTQAILIWR